MHRHGAQAPVAEEGGHELGMADRTAKADRRAVAVLVELIEGVLRPRLGRQRRLQRLGVELRGSPGDLGVIDLVRHAHVTEG